jgi:hypothetical protein
MDDRPSTMLASISAIMSSSEPPDAPTPRK